MKTIERYILRRMTLLFAAALGTALTVVWITQAVGRINLVTDTGQSMSAFLAVATLIMPSLIPAVAPFAVVIAVAQTLSTMNNDSELAVINATGARRWMLAGPAILLGLAVSIASFAIENGLVPYAQNEKRRIVAESNADLFALVIQEGSFRKLEDGLFVQISQRRSDGTLGGIFVADSRNPKTDLIYYAREGRVVKRKGTTVLAMKDGEVQRKAPGGDVSVIKFSTYTFDLSSFAPAVNKVLLFPSDQTLGYLMNPDPNDRYFKGNPQLFRAELHNRFTGWLYPLVFALIAFAAAGDARSHREGGIHPLVTALGAALVVRWLGFVAHNNAETMPAFVWGMYAIPVIASAISGWFIMANRRMEVPVSWSDRTARFAEALDRRYIAFKVWRSGVRNVSGGRA